MNKHNLTKTDLSSKIDLIVKFIFYLNLALFPNFFPESLEASAPVVKISGVYSPNVSLFEGTAIFQFKGLQNGKLYFHLPPNRYSQSDKRTTFQIKTKENQIGSFQRSELGKLKSFRRQNYHAAKSLKVSSVKVNDHLVDYKIIENPALSPTLAIENALLVVDIGDYLTGHEKTNKIRITFKTKFNKSLKDHVKLLWDFAPRPVHEIEGKRDFADHVSKPSVFRYDFQIINSKHPQSETHFERLTLDSVPTCILSEQQQINNKTFLSLNKYLTDDKVFFKKRIQKVQSFLITHGWLQKSEFATNIVTWDGPLTVTASHILLPQRLFRYHPIYYKTFEVILIKSFIQATLKKRFSLNSFSFPWINPAFSSEPIRNYFSLVYNSNTSFFPWGQWLNPDFYQENTVKRWLSKPDENKLLSADEEWDMQFLSNSFHPWHEKGFHLLRTITESEQAMKSQVIPNIKAILSSKERGLFFLNDRSFSELLKLTDKQIKEKQIWLSVEGSVDFLISKVVFSGKDNPMSVRVMVSSTGSLSPPFELSFTLENGLTIREEITNGSGTYEFSFISKPVEISIDPDHKLLENNLLNNYWHTPFKVRPIWDFSSSNSWIVTLTPVINGNTFNRNLFGLSLGASYLNKTELNISAWRGDGDEQLLWESSIFQYAFPWNGSEISLKNSDLNSSFSKSIGYKHSYFDIHKDLWFSVDFLEESLDVLEGDISSDYNTWHSVETSFSFPVYNGDFSDSYVELYNGYGQNSHDSTNDFYQQGILSTSTWYLSNWQFHLSVAANYSYGHIPLQKKYPIGGPEGLPGFPRETDLLYDQRGIATIGLTLPPYLTHTNLNLLRLGWLDWVETSLFFHWGGGISPGVEKPDIFKDAELRFAGIFSWLNMYEGEGALSIAKPIDHERYEDYRIILFSNWVF